MTFSELRKEKHYTQQFLANQLGVKQSTIAMWETGKSVPSTNILLRLSDILKVSVVDLYNSFDKVKEQKKNS